MTFATWHFSIVLLEAKLCSQYGAIFSSEKQQQYGLMIQFKKGKIKVGV